MNLQKLSKIRAPKQLVENRICFAGRESELSIYDTYDAAERVGLRSDQLLYCGMVTGKKVIHDDFHEAQQIFLPHESFVMAPGQYIAIDFPEALPDKPTTCITVEISEERVRQVVEQMNETIQLDNGHREWDYKAAILHTHHTTATQQLLNRIVSLFIEDHPDRDFMIELCITELIVRLLRHEEREFLLAYSRHEPDASGFAAVVNQLKNQLNQPVDIEELSRLACMGRTRLFAEFKKRVGCTPGEFQQQLRIQAAAERLQAGDKVTDVCYDLGYASPSHFSRRFKQFFGCSPREFKRSEPN